MPSSTRPASPAPWSARPIRTRRAPCSAASSRRIPSSPPSIRDDRLVRDALDRDRVRVAVALRPRSRRTRPWSSRCATRDAFDAERSVDEYRASLDVAGVADPDALRALEAPRAPAHRGARPARRRRPPRPSDASSRRSPRCASGARWRSPSPRPDSPSIAMGKLGGRELNYSSDVDVLFVHDGDQADADARGAPAARGDGRADARRDRVPHRRRPPARRAAPDRSPAASTSYRGLVRAVGADLGVPGAHQGAARRRRRRSSAPSFIDARRAVRLARRARPRRGARGPAR